MRVPARFDDKETAILFAMYEVANGTYTSYTLAWKLNPTVQVGTPPAEVAFTETRDATERLIARGLVSGGERLPGANGVYFSKLKLTSKGARAAIQQRNTAEGEKVSAEKAKELKEKIEKLMGGKE